MAIDSHMHINSLSLENKYQAVKNINENNDIEAVINVGMTCETSKEAIISTKQNDKFFCSIGIHPLYTNFQNWNHLYELAENPKVVAIGEIGLDSSKNNFEVQRKYLIRQIIIANELHLPVIIHSNNTNKEIINIFKTVIKPKYGCVFHCFQPDLDDLNYLMTNGFYVSFAGKITYKTAKKSIEVIKNVDNNLFLVETDSPYIPVEPFRDSTSTSEYIKYIIKKVSQVKELEYEEIERITSENTKQLFKRMNIAKK